MPDFDNLPSWAAYEGENPRGTPIVGVDADTMYPTLLEEYTEFYEEARPEEFLKADKKSLLKEWVDAFENLNVSAPSAYWLEVCYQSMKLDLWLATRTSTLEIRIHDPEKAWKQDDAVEGRDPDLASGGLEGAKEARAHYKRLRGFLPS